MIIRSPLRTHSVIVPCRGHAKYLRESLESLKGQWKTLDQIIIVCDDDTEAEGVSKRFISEQRGGLTKYTLIQLESQSGVYAALNVGLKFNESDVISFSGADDMWTPTRSRNIMRCFGDWKVIANTYHQKMAADGSLLNKSIEPLGGAFSYSRKMIESLGMFRQWPCSADSDMFYRAQSLGGHKSIFRAYSYLYRQHGEQLTHAEETGFGSETRDLYQSMWHDGTKHYETELSDHREVDV